MNAPDDAINLLKTDYQTLNSFELSRYIMRLRQCMQQLKIRNNLLLEKKQYLPKIYDNYHYSIFDRNKLDISNFVLSLNYYAITITFDPCKFNYILPVVPDNYQIKYIEECLHYNLSKDHITDIYGSFEKHKSGIIHFHGVLSSYKYPEDFNKSMISFFTNKVNSQKAILIKYVDDLPKWIDYINKESDIFISYNIEINTLEI